MHFHIHVIPKYGKDEGFKIGVGTRYVDEIDHIYKSLDKPIKSLKKI
jgi:diadenosine tetraphosphate (Ap4A) HIT family hydrolase